MVTDRYQDFRAAVDRPDDGIDLGRAALAIASSDYPNLDLDVFLSRIDQLAVAVSGRLGNASSVYRAIAALNYVLFQEQGFHGNRENYFDPRNSFLNDVIERKTGIPITMSVLYMEVAQRIGLPLHGVGFPGHFLVKYRDDNGEIVIDPFDAGEIRSMESLEKLLRELYGGKMALHPSLLEPVTKKQILRRILNNLKVIYLRENVLLKGISVMDRLLILDPASPEDLRDRGVIHLKLECFTQALSDLEAYLRLAPDAVDAADVRGHVVALSKQVTQIH